MRMNPFFAIAALILSLQAIAQDKHYSEWYLQREDVNIFVKEIGTGKDTVIVVHGGFGANHDYMLDAIKGLEKKCHFVLYDQRGSLLSPTEAKNLTFQKNVDDLAALANALKLKKVNLLCHSMGTLVGMEFTRLYPDRVAHLVLTGSVLPQADSIGSVFSDRYNQQIEFLESRKEVHQLLQPYYDKGISNLQSVAAIDTSLLTHKDLTEYWRINFASTNVYHVNRYNLLKGGWAYYNANASIMSETVNWHYDYRAVLNNNGKTTIINGDHDFFDFNGETLTTQLQDYPAISLRILPKAGHNSWVDEPNAFAKLLLQALRK